MLGHGLYFGIKFLLDLDYVFLVILGDQVDGEADLSIPAAPANPVQIGAPLVWEVEVDDDIDGRDVDASSNEVGAN